MFKQFLLLLSIVVALASAQQYRPVVLMHGINSNAETMLPVKEWIEQALPGIYVVNMEVGGGKLSSIFTPMDEQVRLYAENIAKDPLLANGFNAIGFSQGTLVTRGYVQRYNNPPVYNYIGMNGPQRGQFGVPYVNVKWIDQILGEAPYEHWAQHTFSAAQYWRDPYAIDDYLEKSLFLADLNNERDTKNATYGENINKLNAMVLTYSINEEVIVPRESGWFGFYADDTQKTIVPLREQPFYTEDWIGLRTLDEAGKLFMFNTNCTHTAHIDPGCGEANFLQYTLPYLSQEI